MAAESTAESLGGEEDVSIMCADETGFRLYAIGSSDSEMLP